MADDEEDEGGFGGAFENGHWEWNDKEGQLAFVSDLPPKAVEVLVMPTKAPTGIIQFNDDIDVIEQLRFRKYYQRKIKPGERAVITLQDVKDIALFTAPLNLLSPMLINILHLPTTERFLRALIFYCQYYLQTADEMARRMLELDFKVRTPDGEHIETEYRDNICDLRLLVAKEYCTMLVGGADMKNFHHMGPAKKRKSLSDKDARLIETLLRMCIQIVWIALGRKSFNQIEVEVNRLFKSEEFNSAEHRLKTDYINKMTKEERNVLIGPCLSPCTKLDTCSPLLNEIYCYRPMDYRVLGLGVVKYPKLPHRLRLMQQVISLPEELFSDNSVVLGVLGLDKSTYDTMLRRLPVLEPKSKASSVASKLSSISSKGKKSSTITRKQFSDIMLPSKPVREDEYPESFPEESEKIRSCSEIQRKRWLNRYIRLIHPHSSKGKKKTNADFT